MKDKIVFYHKDCKDGIGSAYAAKKNLGETADYIPLAYGEPLKAVLDSFEPGAEIYFVDFSLKKDAMISVSEKAGSIQVIDHHDSAEKELIGLPDNVKVIFDMDKSGATMTWDYFNEGPVPEILRYIEDADLWKWKLKDSEAFAEGIKVLTNHNDLDQFFTLAENPATVSYFIEAGIPLVEQRDKKVEVELARIRKDVKARTVSFDGKDFIFLNLTDRDLTSVTGNMIAKEFGIAAALYYLTSEGEANISLRSTPEIGEIASTAIAFGGGGHPMAGGMQIPLEKLNQLFREKKISSKENINSILGNDEILTEKPITP